MAKLLKSQNWTVALVTVICLGLMVLVLPRMPDRACTMPAWALILGEYLWVVIVLLCVQAKSLRRSMSNLKLAPAFSSLGLIFLTTAVGVIVNPIAKLGNDGTISLGLAQLAIMNLGALFLIFASAKGTDIAETINVADEEDPNSATSTNIKRLTQIRIKAVNKSHENLMAQKLPPELEALREATLQGIDPVVNFEPKNQMLTSSSNALSKSGQNIVPGLSQQQPKRAGGISAEQLMQKFKRSSDRQSPEIATQEGTIIQANSDSSTQEKDLPPEMKRLAKVQNKAAEPHKSSTKTNLKLQGLSASGTGAANVIPGSGATAEPTGLRSVLDRLDVPDEAMQPIQEQAAALSESTNNDTSIARSQSIFKQPVDSDMDQLFAQIAPAESQKEINEAPFADANQTMQDFPANNNATGNVFGKSVDKDMDDLFSKIVPIESQKEVGSVRAEVQVDQGAFVQNAVFEMPTPVMEVSPTDALPNEASVIKEVVNEVPIVVEQAIEITNIQELGAEGATADQIAKSEEEAKVFKSTVDGQIDDIFSGLAPMEAQREVGSTRRAPETDKSVVMQSPILEKGSVENEFAQESMGGGKIEEDAKAKEAEEAAKVFKSTVDGQIDDIFSALAPSEAQREVSSVNSKVEQTIAGEVTAAPLTKTNEQLNSSKNAEEITGERAPVNKNFADNQASEKTNVIPELKDFGRLSAKASAEPETTTQVGTMKTIGKLLIDSQSVENLIKKAESGKITVNLPSAHVISVLRGQGIQSLLENIDTCEGVEGSMLVGADGLVISSTYTSAGDRDGTGVLAHGVLGNTNIGVMRLDLGKLEQMILVSRVGEKDNQSEVTTVFTDVGVGMLSVFLDKKFKDGLDSLLDKITLIAQG